MLLQTSSDRSNNQAISAFTRHLSWAVLAAAYRSSSGSKTYSLVDDAVDCIQKPAKDSSAAEIGAADEICGEPFSQQQQLDQFT